MQLIKTAALPVLALSLTTTISLAHGAENTASDGYVSAMRYVSLDVQGDNADSRQYSGIASFALGKYMWLQGSAGTLTDNSAASLGDLHNFGAGTGFKNEHVQLSLNFSDYKNDTTYKQRDVAAALSWIDDRFTVGLDIFHRNTDNSLDTTRSFPTLGLSNVALHIDETLTGNGFGAHADFNITDALNVSLGGMSYNYDSGDYELTSSSNPILIRRLLAKHPTISQLLYLNDSGVTRSLALLESSYNAGVSYQFSSVALSAQYLRDKALDNDDVTQTVTLGASIFLGDHFIVAPMVGKSSSDLAEDVTFGGLSLSYNW